MSDTPPRRGFGQAGFLKAVGGGRSSQANRLCHPRSEEIGGPSGSTINPAEEDRVGWGGRSVVGKTIGSSDLMVAL